MGCVFGVGSIGPIDQQLTALLLYSIVAVVVRKCMILHGRRVRAEGLVPGVTVASANNGLRVEIPPTE